MTKQINITGGSMGLPGPELKKCGTFEHKLFGVRRLCEPIQQTLEPVARQYELKVLSAFARQVDQSLADGSDHVERLPVGHTVASR